jgi:hypothetical protein
MRYSPAPDRPRTPVALLKTEAEPAPPNERTPDSCQADGLLNALAVQDHNPTRRRMTGGARRNHERVPGQFGAHAVVKRFCLARVACRIARLDSSPESQFDQLHCLFPPFMVGYGLPFPGCFVVSMLKNLSRFVSASRPENARRIWLVGGENPADVAVAMYSTPVSVKAAPVRNSWMQALILNQGPHCCRRKQSP